MPLQKSATDRTFATFTATMLDRLDLVFRFMFWEFRMELVDGTLIPGLSRRVQVHREENRPFWEAVSFTVDVVRRTDLQAHWRTARVNILHARADATTVGRRYWILSDRAISATTAANVRRLLPYHRWPFNEAVTQALYDALPPGSCITVGILLRRMIALGHPPQQVEGDLLHLLSRRTVQFDLTRPLGPGSLVLRPWPRPRRSPKQSVQRTPPPWVDCGKY